MNKKITITKTECKYVREKLLAPFGFKGGFLSELWQIVSKVECKESYGVGVGLQSVLWSDAEIFRTMPEEDGNLLMFRITEYAMTLLTGCTGTTPIELIDSIYDDVLAYARKISPTGNSLAETFVRNALVSVDNALWQMFGKLAKTEDIMMIIPDQYHEALGERQETLCNVPLISYGVKEDEIRRLLDTGTVLLKIKIGFDNGGAMTKQEMLEWDKARIKQIHDIAKSYTTTYTESGHILYYMDANGGYDTIERITSLIEYTQEIGVYERIALLEEPFPSGDMTNVSSLRVLVAADESVHSLEDAKERIALGYSAITLKPIAKTLSETLKILKYAYEMNIPCFCADLTVPPVMVEFNRNVAARIPRIPGMKAGILESNGAQNYVGWERLKSYHPMADAKKSFGEDGLYHQDDEFFENSGGIFRPSNYYDNLF